MTAAIKPTVASQLTVPINSSVIRQAPVLAAKAPDTGEGTESTSVKKEPRRVRAAQEGAALSPLVLNTRRKASRRGRPRFFNRCCRGCARCSGYPSAGLSRPGSGGGPSRRVVAAPVMASATHCASGSPPSTWSRPSQRAWGYGRDVRDGYPPQRDAVAGSDP